MQVVGVDGTKEGWVAIALDEGGFASDFVLRPIETDFRELMDARVIAVDIPIGYGPRKADAAARSFVTGAASTVFTTPRREVLENALRTRPGVSAQSHALGPRIVHLTSLARKDPRFYEVHPEVSFSALNHGRPLHYRKKSSGGALEHIEALRRHGIELANLGAAASMPLDDVLDAAAAAWSASRILSGEARMLPDPPEVVVGHPVAIWY